MPETRAFDQTTTTDATAIAALFARLTNAWNRGDGAAYGRCFTDDADYIDVTGAHSRGDAIGRIHQFLFDGPLRGSTLEWDGQGPQARFLTPEVAVAIGSGAARWPDQGHLPSDRESINTTVLVKRDGEWRITAFQNNRVKPSAAPGAGR